MSDERAPDRPSDKDADRKARLTRALNNLIVGAFLLALMAGGVWLLNAIDASQKAQECLESGRRSCRIIDAQR